MRDHTRARYDRDVRIHRLELQSIGPFDEATIEFGDVTLLTGENGTGKSIVLDTIRTLFGSEYLESPTRPVHRPPNGAESAARIWLDVDGQSHDHTATVRDGRLQPIPIVHNLPSRARRGRGGPSWVVHYWQSTLSNAPVELKGLTQMSTNSYLDGALSGVQTNLDTAQFIVQVDYLRGGDDPAERGLGELLWRAIETICEQVLLGGRLRGVSRARLEPRFVQHGHELTLDQLNSGSLYLLQRMLDLLARMYGCHVTTGRDARNLLQLPGLLLIDEAENHLHPKWQRRLLPMVREIFPSLQLVIATHSPFVVASAPERTKVHVCEKSNMSCVIRDVSGSYRARPIDDVLTSEVFSETQPFGEEIARLLQGRARAIEDGDTTSQTKIEAELKRLNPGYFAYLDIDEIAKAVLGQ